MRHLNKTIFINSATIRYQEVMLDGNVHFIGTQGVGKSTLLRAILFFYNGDTQKLGIPREKKLFAEYYFPHTNSYILYEVQRESGPFTVMAMRSGSGVMFRFVDAAYSPDWMLRDQQALERWGDIRQGLDQRGIDTSNRIDRLQEYRDIIYGSATANPAYRKYALLESKQYQNIPRTITNVFLNTRLEAGFIKETIIHSLSEEELQIDLVIYTNHLRGFEQQYGDIQKFKEKKTQEQAEKISTGFNKITSSKASLMQAASQLGTASKLAEKELEKQKGQWKKKIEQKNALQQEFEQKEKRQQDQLNLITRDIKVLENSIREANKKEKEYGEKGIEGILQRHTKKQEWESGLQRLTGEKQLLTTKFESIEQQFEVRLRQLENNIQQLENERKGEENLLQKNVQAEKDKLRKRKETERQGLEEVFEERFEEIRGNEKTAREKQTGLKENRSSLKERVWLGPQIQKLQDETNTDKAGAHKASNTVEIHTEKIAQLKKDWEREEEKLNQDTETKKEALRKELSETETELKKTQQKLDNYQNALYGFLQKNYPNWQNTIGRVAREDLLFNETLEPRLKESAKLFYGLELNLEQVETSAKSLEQYELEKKNLEQSLQQLQKDLAATDVELKKGNDRLKERFQPKIRAHKDEVQKLTFESGQLTENARKKELELEILFAKAKEEKEAALQKAEAEILEVETHIKKLEKEQQEQKQQWRAEKQRLEQTLVKQFKVLEKELAEKIAEVTEGYKAKIQNIEKRIVETKEQRNQKLADEGADTKRLKNLEDEIAIANTELKFIADTQQLVIEYQKDKRELFDKTDDFKKGRDREQQKLQRAEERLEGTKTEHRKKLAEIGIVISEVDGKIKTIENGFKDLQTFAQSEIYSEMEALMQPDTETAADPYEVAALIQQLRDLKIGLNQLQDDLRDATNRFLSGFGEANLFHFGTSPTTLQDYMAFAANLREFIDENKIAEYERRVNERFASILSLVSKETGNLISREGEIQKVISKINGDFRARNFVGVIQSMELKIDDSDNRVVRTLKRIREYEQERGFELGEQNLFNSASADAHNQRAIEFLRQLARDIAEAKQEQIRLSDAFELRFRVVENENDSGWVEKLSNVGSEGTDVLVKAMINILLLNVFKESASRKFRDFRLHCMMDEIGRLHPTNVRGILKFANDRNIMLINGSPVEQDAMAYRHIYELRKDKESRTRIQRLITVHQQENLKAT